MQTIRAWGSARKTERRRQCLAHVGEAGAAPVKPGRSRFPRPSPELASFPGPTSDPRTNARANKWIVGAISATGLLLSPVGVFAQSINSGGPASPAPETVAEPDTTGQVPDQLPPAATPAPETVPEPVTTGQVPDQPPPAATPAPETVAEPDTTGQVPDQPPPAATPAPETGTIPEERPPAVLQPRPATSQAARQNVRPEPSERVSPSQVFRTTRDLLAEIEIIRAEFAISHFPPRAEVIEGRAPVHAYAKSLEVLAKVIQVQRRLGLPPARMGHLPVRTIDSADVLDRVEYVLQELRGIKSQMAIDRQIETAPLESGSTSSMNYRNLADASLMLDGLVGRTLVPADVYRNALSVLDELELVAAMLGVSLRFELAPVEQEITFADVVAQVLRATYKAINLQTRLQMEPSEVPAMTLVRVSPSESYDATNLLLAEIARIKAHLGVTLTRAERPNLPLDQRSKDVFALVTLIARNIDKVAAAVGN